MNDLGEDGGRGADPAARRIGGRRAMAIVALIVAVSGALAATSRGSEDAIRDVRIEIGPIAEGSSPCNGLGACPAEDVARSDTPQESEGQSATDLGRPDMSPGRDSRRLARAVGQPDEASASTSTVVGGSDEPSTTTSTVASNNSGATSTTEAATTTEAITTTTASTTTATASTTTATTTTSEPPGDTVCCGEGRAGVFVVARSAFDRWSEGGYFDFFNANYERMLVYEPYWDSRLDDYDDVVVYKNTYAIYVSSSRDDRATEHPDWILREADGTPVYIDWGCSGGCPQYAADVSNRAYQDDFLDAVAELRSRGYPGLLLDDVNMSWRFSDKFGDDATPIDPNTGRPLTIEAWRQHLVEFLERIRVRFPDTVIAHNAIWYTDSPSFDDPFIDRQIAAADIIELERGATDSGLVAGTGRFGFQTFLRYIDRVHRLGGNVILLDESADSVEDQWFNLAATLLINDGDDLVSTEQWSAISPDGFWSGFDTDLGHALGPRYLEGGLIRRNFTGGIVLLNEPGGSSVRATLSEPMRLPDGQLVDEVVVGGREAVVLYRA